MKISVGEVLDTIQKEEKGLQSISDKLGFSMSAITDRLRELHYAYDGMEDTWIWKGIESENRDIPFTIEPPKQVYSREIQPLNLSLFKNSNEQHKPSPKILTKDKLFKRNEEELMKTISEAINHKPKKQTTPKEDNIGGKTDMLELTETNMFDSLKGIPTMTNLETKTVLVKDVMITLNNSLNTKEAAKKIGVGAKRLSKRLKELGYAFHQSSKSWEYEGEGQEPMNEVFIELKPVQTSLGLLDTEETQEPKQIDTFTLSQKEEDSKANEGQEHINLVLLNEIQSIKDMLNHKEDKATDEVIVENKKSFTPNDLFARILELEQGDKTRKTLVIDETIGEKLDTFADKYKRKVNKSDILEIALLDFFAKYPLPE